MANIFLNKEPRDVETAIMLEQAIIHDIKNAVAYTDGDRIFINTEENLEKILPDYNHDMLKWLLWHERFHKELKHHKRFYKYLDDLDKTKEIDKFAVTKDEVNIIMDILVHDSLSKLFPELVDTAVNNLAQMRNRNSLKFTFTTKTLEKMLDEYRKHKEDMGSESESRSKDEGEDIEGEDKGEGEGKSEGLGDTPSEDKKEKEGKTPRHAPGGGEDDSKSKPEDGKPEIKEDEPMPEPEHDKTDWSKLDKIDSKEFIEDYEGDHYIEQINALKRKKLKLARLTETLNGLVTSTRRRTYSMPSTIHIGNGVLLKGSVPGRTQLYLCFDASGSMGSEMATFKDIIAKSIPQAMDTPTTWFSGYGETVPSDPDGRNSDYYKGKFRDFMPVRANSGYGDDGDRTIELCWKAEQLGYSPIGVTDGGGTISWSKDMLKQLKRTILVGPNDWWLEEAKSINHNIQIIEV